MLGAGEGWKVKKYTSIHLATFFNVYLFLCYKIVAVLVPNNLDIQRHLEDCGTPSLGGLFKHHLQEMVIQHIFAIPIGSMYGIFTYMYHKNQLNVGNHTIHGSYGIVFRRQLVDSNKNLRD